MLPGCVWGVGVRSGAPRGLIPLGIHLCRTSGRHQTFSPVFSLHLELTAINRPEPGDVVAFQAELLALPFQREAKASSEFPPSFWRG